MTTPYDVSSRSRDLMATADEPRGALAGWAATAAVWRRNARTRRQLAGLEDHELRDIGLSRPDAEAEAAKPFWRP